MPDTPTLTFGLSRVHSAGSGLVGDHGQRLAEALQELLGQPVQPVLTDTYGDLVEALCSARVDVAWLPPLLQSEAQARGARLLALTQRGGSVAYRSALLVEKDSRFQQARELLGARAA